MEQGEPHVICDEDEPRDQHSNGAGTPQPHFMLVPSLSCPASCSYCFGPHNGPVMTADTMDATLNFIARIADETRLRKPKVTFHGGEPLMAGHAIIRQALDGLDSRFGRGRCDVALQSNLWLLDDEFCDLFREHRVEIGTSLDGPREITDSQRGDGYYDRTMRGIRLARAHGLDVGCIATFTPPNAPRWRQVFDFFLAERLNFSIHPSVPPLGMASPFALAPARYGELLRDVLGHYVVHRREIAVSSLDQICQAFSCGEGKVCTFRDCLGMFLAIDPNGDIFACQRFCGRPEYRLGRLADRPSFAELMASTVAHPHSQCRRAVACRGDALGRNPGRAGPICARACPAAWRPAHAVPPAASARPCEGLARAADLRSPRRPCRPDGPDRKPLPARQQLRPGTEPLRRTQRRKLRLLRRRTWRKSSRRRWRF